MGELKRTMLAVMSVLAIILIFTLFVLFSGDPDLMDAVTSSKISITSEVIVNIDPEGEEK